MMSEEVKELYEELVEYANGGMSALYPSEEDVKIFIDYIEQLQQENKKIKFYLETKSKEYESLEKAIKLLGDYKDDLEQENKELARLVANKVIIDYDYDSILKNELIEEKRRNITLEESKNMTENILNELESWLEGELKNNIDGIKSFGGYQCKRTLDKLKESKGEVND